MAHIYLRVLPPESEDTLTDAERIDNLRVRTQFIPSSYWTLAIAKHQKGGLGFGIDRSSIDLEIVVQKLSIVGYTFVI